MSQHPDQFPLLMVNMVGAGETGGFLDDALDRIAKMYESDAALRAKIKSALTYPVIVLIFSLLMGTGVIIFIVPIFETMFSPARRRTAGADRSPGDAVPQRLLGSAVGHRGGRGHRCGPTGGPCSAAPRSG